MTKWARGREPLTRRSVVSLGIAVVAVLVSLSVPADATTRSEAPSPHLLQSLDPSTASQVPWIRLAYGVELTALAGYHRRPDDLTRAEDRAFRGIGAIVCTLGGTRRSSTAFLVGTFDIAVTVARTFQHKDGWARASDCVYHSADRAGQIRERIPIAYFKTQWHEEPSSFGQSSMDLAMVRLSRASHFADRTLSFSRFSGSAAPVMLIGFRADPDYEPLKHKRSGMLFEDADGNFRTSGIPRLMHDVDTRGLASGAPLMDRRDGVVIGIHAKVSSEPSSLDAKGSKHARRNAMLVMTEWLEQVLRAEISQFPDAHRQQTTAR